MPRKTRHEIQQEKNKEAVPTEPQEEITRVFKEITGKDGAQHVQEQPSISPPPPKETLVNADNEAKNTDL